MTDIKNKGSVKNILQKMGSLIALFILLIVFGAIMESNLAWDISDTFNGLMMIPNLIGLLAQVPIIIKLTRNYVDRRIKLREIEPMLSYDPDIQNDAAKAVKRGID